MFKTRCLITSGLLMLSIATTNASEYKSGFFIKGEVGKIFAQKFKDTPTSGYIDGNVSNYALYGAGAGYKFNEMFSANLGIQYRRFKYNAMLNDRSVSQNINNYSVLLNGFYSIPTSTLFTPYLSAGIGYTYNKPSDLKSSVNSNDPDILEEQGSSTASKQNSQAFIWNLGLGTKVKISKAIDLDLSYRYINLGKVKVQSTVTDLDEILSAASQNLNGHQITLGIIFNI